MGIFDIFKRKKKTPQPEVKPEATQQAPAAEEQKASTVNEGLKKTKESFFSKIGKTFAGKTTVDALFLDNLEEVLIAADVGVQTTIKIIDRLEARVAKDKYLTEKELVGLLKEEVARLFAEAEKKYAKGYDLPTDAKPYVFMVVGVNGVGKTTTIGKLAYQFKNAGKQVMLGASDTFRAAAVNQLTIWSERADVPITSRGMGADPAAVAFDTVQSAQSKGCDVVLLDTAGRLHNKINLMNELSKVKRVMKKVMPDAPHEVMLVLDASTGQNAIEQAKKFMEATEVDSIALTKLDGTAKGGVVIGIADQFNIPIRFIGVGEQMYDLKLFDKDEFVEALFEKQL